MNIGIALPSTDTSLIYQEGSKGLTLETIQSFAGLPSETGLLPYFIRTVHIWSDLADFNVNRKRNHDKFPPTDPRSCLFQLSSKAQDWFSSLPVHLQWNSQNYQTHCHLGQGTTFVSMHMLLRTSLCVAHQAYLPQLDGFTVLYDSIDAAGWPFLHREISLIETCVSNAMAIGELLTTVLESPRGKETLQSLWVAISLLSAANTFLWIVYAGDEAFSGAETQDLARKYFETIGGVFTTWQSQWKTSKRWYSSLNAMHAMYRAAYLGDLGQSPAPDVSSPEDEDDLCRDYRPEPGDGYPSLVDLPDLQASLRVVACDSSAKPMDVQTVWIQLSSGWPHEPGGLVDLFPV